jgi:hypothetical protein
LTNNQASPLHQQQILKERKSTNRHENSGNFEALHYIHNYIVHAYILWNRHLPGSAGYSQWENKNFLYRYHSRIVCNLFTPFSDWLSLTWIQPKHSWINLDE